jgi:hypothetical protein
MFLTPHYSRVATTPQSWRKYFRHRKLHPSDTGPYADWQEERKHPATPYLRALHDYRAFIAAGEPSRKDPAYENFFNQAEKLWEKVRQQYEETSEYHGDLPRKLHHVDLRNPALRKRHKRDYRDSPRSYLQQEIDRELEFRWQQMSPETRQQLQARGIRNQGDFERAVGLSIERNLGLRATYYPRSVDRQVIIRAVDNYIQNLRARNPENYQLQANPTLEQDQIELDDLDE